MSLGGIGVISVLSNIAPKMTHDIVASYLNGDVETSRKLQLQAMDLNDVLFCEVNPIPVKAALNMMGICEGNLRSPLCEMSEAHKEQMKSALERHQLI